MRPLLRKTLKIALWTIGSVIALFLLLVLLIQIPYFQNIAKDRAVAYLEKKIGTEVRLDRIEIGLPKNVILEGLYLEDQKKDTLVYGEKFKVDISLMKLLSNEVEVNSVDLTGIVANVRRDASGKFNFDYIIRAFASQETKKDSAAPMKFSIDRINLDRVRVNFDDDKTKNDLYVDLRHFDTRIKSFDLAKSEFEIPVINLSGLKANLRQGLAEEIVAKTADAAIEASNKSGLKLVLREINLSDIDLGYESDAQKLELKTQLGRLNIDVNEFDLQGQKLDFDKLDLRDTSVAIRMKKGKPAIKGAADSLSAKAKSGWKAALKEAFFHNVNFRLDDENEVATTKGIDYAHLDLRDFSLDARNVTYTPKTIAANIRNLSVKEKSGLNILELKTNIAYTETGASVSNMLLRTPKTTVRDRITVTYPGLDAVKNDIGRLSVDADIQESKIAFSDILLLAPDLEKQDPFRKYPNAILNIDSRISGRLADLTIPNLEISGIGNTTLAASGKIKGLPDAKKLSLDLKIRDFRSTASDIAGFLPGGTLPNTIRLPERFSVNGSFKGTPSQFNTNLNVVTSSGNAKIKAFFDNRVKDRERYDADVSLDNFDVGRLIRNDSVGKVTLMAKVKGSSLNPKYAKADIKGYVNKAEFNGYTYKDLDLTGKADNGYVTVNADMNDPNLTFVMAGEGNFKDKFPAVKVKLNVDIADLEKLNLHAGPLKIRGNVDADFPVADLDNLNGEINASKISIANATEQFPLDSINIVAVSTAERDSITVKSQFLSAKVAGNYKLSEIGNAVSNSISKYYNTGKSVKPKGSKQSLEFDVLVKNDPILMKILPQLKSLEPVTLKGRYESANDSIVVVGSLPKLVYGENVVSGVKLNVETKDDGLAYNILVDDIQNATLRLPFTKLDGTVKDDVVAYNLQLKDIKDKDQYLLSGTLESKNGRSVLRLNPENFMLNYDTWSLPEDNEISFGKAGLYIDNFRIENEGSVLQAQSQSRTPGAPIDLTFTDFQIETITDIVKKKDLDVSGTIDGTAQLRNLDTQAHFTSDLNIRKLTFRKEAVGDINIKVDNLTANTLSANVVLSGNENDLKLTGTYRTDNGALDLDLDMSKLTMKSVETFAMGNLTESSGFLSGKMKITGTMAAPKVNGDLQFNDVAFRAKQLNSKFQGINEKIVFNDSGLQFDKFTISDSDQNTLVIDGSILTKTFTDFAFNLDVDADNFKAVDSKEKDSDLFYGKLYVDTSLKVRGDLDSPVVSGRLKVNEDTDFTVVLPQQDPSVQDREGIVEFVDRDSPPMIDKRIALKDSLATTKLRGIDASVNIEVTKDATLSLIVDKGNGDYLKLKGEAQLTGGIDPSGKTTLIGRYEFSEGAYEMTFNLLKRKFDIKDGSYILWTGEPTTADVNITAVYETQAAPIDLVQEQLGNLTPEQRNRYKQRIPFQTELMMNGQLLKPEITFDIVIPEGNYNVATEITDAAEARLAQLRQEPAELNKQVFALLLLNRFIGENPFASEAGGTSAESIARQSASKILSQQLNNLAADLINGVELNFDLESTDDYTTGQLENRTDLNVGISKKLLNDRLKVTVGSNFGLEGPQQANEETNNIAGDVSVDYQLTKDGRYVVRAYRKNQYEIALQGQVVETGVAFIITMDYKKFRELFHRSEEEKQLRKERREKEKQAREEKRKKDAETVQEQDEDKRN